MSAQIIDLEEVKGKRMAALRAERLAGIFTIDIASGRLRIEGTVEEVRHALITGQIEAALWLAEAAL